MMYRLISILLLSVALSSCFSESEASADKVVIYAIDGTQLAELVSDAEVKAIKKAIDNREETIVKILPIYDIQLQVVTRRGAESWKYSAIGYLEDTEQQLYRAEIPALNAFLKN